MNGLVTSHWRSFDAARAALDVRGLLPLWHYYIVSKTQAMASLAVHAVMFAPVGVLLSLRGKSPRAGAIQAAMIAFVFALLVEIGRWLRPGLQPDFNDAVIAAVSAWLAARAMPSIWLMVGSLSRGDETMVGKQPLDQSAA
jgi:VanZ family protein